MIKKNQNPAKIPSLNQDLTNRNKRYLTERQKNSCAGVLLEFGLQIKYGQQIKRAATGKTS